MYAEPKSKSRFVGDIGFEPFAQHHWPAHIRVTRPAGNPVTYQIRSVAPDGREPELMWVRTAKRGKTYPTEFFDDRALTRLAFTLRPGIFRYKIDNGLGARVVGFSLTLWSMLFVTSWKFRDTDGRVLFVLRERWRDAIWRRLVFFPFRGCFDGDLAGLFFAPLFAPFFFVKGHPRISIEMPGHGQIGYLAHSKWHSPASASRCDSTRPSRARIGGCWRSRPSQRPTSSTGDQSGRFAQQSSAPSGERLGVIVGDHLRCGRQGARVDLGQQIRALGQPPGPLVGGDEPGFAVQQAIVEFSQVDGAGRGET